jgi:hypothetical protein
MQDQFTDSNQMQALVTRLRRGILTPLNIKYLRWSPLHRAVIFRKPLREIQAICSRLTHAELDSQDAFKYTPMDHAIIRRNPDAAKLLDAQQRQRLYNNAELSAIYTQGDLELEVFGDRTRQQHINTFIDMYCNPSQPIYGM